MTEKSILNKQQSPRDSTLLAVLPAECYQRLLPHLRQTTMERGEIIHDSRSQAQYLYFPITGIVSLMYGLEDGSSTEVAVIGNEGVVGVAQLMGGNTFLYKAVVQGAGYAYRINANELKAEFNKGGVLQHQLLLYTQALITQISQTAVCNRHHNIEQQLCRWLLLCLDRVTTNKLSMTQEQIANNLGVRRVGVTDAAIKLQTEKLIQYSRGLITVLDRRRMEARVCECYRVVQNEYNRLLPSTGISSPRNPQYTYALQVASR